MGIVERPFWSWSKRAVNAALSQIQRALGLWFSLSFVAVTGALLLVVAQLGHFPPLLKHFVQELGVACVISVVLAVLIEVNVSRRIAAGSLDAIMGVNIPTDVWAEIREHIIGATVIRENYHVNVVLDDHPRLDGLYGATSTMSYQLKSLRSLHHIDVEHDLDRDLTGLEDDQPLPRFVRATVGDTPYEGAELARVVSASGAALKIRVDFTRVGDTQKVDVESRSLVRIPDSRSWWMPFTTQNPRVTVEHRPGVAVFEVEACHPRQDRLIPRRPGKTWEFDGIMLPGQGFSVRSFLRPKEGVASVLEDAPKELRALLELYRDRFSSVQPVLRDWIAGGFSAMTRIMKEGQVALPLDDAAREISKVYGRAEAFVVATNVGSTRFYFKDKRYIEGNQSAPVPIIRFYLYSQHHEIELRAHPRGSVTVDAFIDEVRELHGVLGSVYSVVINMDITPAYGSRDVLLLDNKFLVETRVDDRTWGYFQARASEDSRNLREARSYLLRLSASNHAAAFSMSDEEISRRFAAYVRVDTDIAKDIYEGIMEKIRIEAGV